MLPRALTWPLLTALLAAPVALAPAPARACQLGCTPIQLVLTYLPNLSNWGPTGATGVVELVLAESEARGRVTGLPALADERYQAWLIDTTTDTALPFGAFTTDQSQRAQFRFILDEDIPDRRWNLFLLTVEPLPDPEPGRQSDKRSIGAFFQGLEQKNLTPRELPNTGDAAAPLNPPNTGGTSGWPPQAPQDWGVGGPAVPERPAAAIGRQGVGATPVPIAPAPPTPPAAPARAAPRPTSSGGSSPGTLALVGVLGAGSLVLSMTMRARRAQPGSTVRRRRPGRFPHDQEADRTRQ